MSQPTYSVHVYNPPLLEYLQAVEFGDDEVVRHLRPLSQYCHRQYARVWFQ